MLRSRAFVVLLTLVVVGVISIAVLSGDSRPGSGRAQHSATARRASGKSYRGLSPTAAVTVARRAHPELLTAPLWKPLALRRGERVRSYVTDHVARIGPPHGRGAVVESALPLRVRDARGRKRPVDLTLRETSTSFVASNPLATMRIARTVGGGVELPDVRMRVTPLGTRSATPGRVVEGRAVFPNAYTDTDIVDAPAPSGVETYAQLRSERSPEDIALRLSLPTGATTHRDRRMGGLAIVRHGRTLAHVAPPAAWDASRRRVATRYSVAGHTLRMHVAHRDTGAAYPVVLDPAIVEDFRSWRTNSALDFNGWNYETTNAAKFTPFYGSSYLGNGLYMYNRTVQPYAAGDTRRWFFNVLGFGSAFIYRADFTNLYHEANSTCLTEGIFSRSANAYEAGSPVQQCSAVTTYPSATACVRTDCTAAGSTGNTAMFGIKANTTATLGSFTGYLGGAAIYETDNVTPTMTSAGIPAGWVESASGMTVSGTDAGMGMVKVALDSPSNASWDQNRTKDFTPCGDRNHRCPKIVQPDPFATGSLPQGVDTIRATGTSAVGVTATGTFPIKIDKSPPSITNVSGTLYGARNGTSDHRGEGLYGPSYALHVDAGDSLSGAKSIEVFVDNVSQAPTGGLVSGTCASDGCGKSLDWTLNTDSLSEGDHTVKIVASDQVYGTPGSTDSLHQATLSFPVTVDRVGDIYTATQYDDAPANGGDVVATEVAQLGTRNARRTDDDETSTRRSVACTADPNQQCGEVRYDLKDDSTDDTSDGPGDTYAVYKGTSVNDPRLDAIATILDPANTSLGTPTQTGPIASALQPWQTAPPAHGTTYAMYETNDPNTTDGASDQETQRLYIDQATQMPLRQTTISSNQTETDVYYSYDRQRLTTSQVPSDEFAVPAPANTSSSSSTDYATDTQPAPQGDPNVDSQQQQFDDAKAFRQQYGLNTTDAFITSSLTDPTYAGAIDDYGVPLSPSEQSEMALRRTLEDNMTIVENYGASHADTYAGAYIDQAGGGLVYVGFTALADVRLQELKAVYPNPERLRSFNATLNEDGLDSLYARVVADNDQLRADGFPVTTISENDQDNSVDVAVPSPTPTQQAQILARYGSPNVHLVQGDQQVVASDQVPAAGPKGDPVRIRYPIPPLFGGLYVDDKQESCSTGFSVRRGHKYREIIAGHCGPKGKTWTHWNTGQTDRITLGPAVKRSYSNHSRADAELFRINRKYATNRVLLRSKHYRKITSTASFGAGQIRDRHHKGTTVCSVGWREAKPRCGPLVSERATINECKDDACTSTVTFDDQKQAAYKTRPGDSGGSVYRKNGAWGISVAVPRGKSSPTTFTPISNIISRFGITVVGAG